MFRLQKTEIFWYDYDGVSGASSRVHWGGVDIGEIEACSTAFADIVRKCSVGAIDRIDVSATEIFHPIQPPPLTADNSVAGGLLFATDVADVYVSCVIPAVLPALIRVPPDPLALVRLVETDARLVALANKLSKLAPSEGDILLGTPAGALATEMLAGFVEHGDIWDCSHERARG